MTDSVPAFQTIAPGAIVDVDGRSFQVKHPLDFKSVLAIDLDTGRSQVIGIQSISTTRTNSDPDRVSAQHDLAQMDEEKWQIAHERYDVLKSYLDAPVRSRKLAQQLAEQAEISVATFYNWLKAYRVSEHVSGLLPTARGPRHGITKLSDEQNQIIDEAIEKHFLTKQRLTPTDIVQQVKLMCHRANIPAPHGNTVRNRIRAIPESVKLRRQGRVDEARDRFEPIRDQFPGADFPLAVTQIDHTPADVIIVDEQNRLPLGRPTLTLQIDVRTRIVTGLAILLESPSTISVGLCVSMSMLPKTGYLEELGVEGDWPVWGRPGVLHVDNAKEFRGRMLRKACVEYGIDLQMRPVKRPHYGGHIERLMGTAANEIRKLPGTTFSNTRQRKGYKSEQEAALTLKEFERQIVDFIVNIYHQRVHSELGMSPLKRWELDLLGDTDMGPARGLPAVPNDPGRLLIDFLPFEERSVQRYGVALNGIRYTSGVLTPWIASTDPKKPKEKRKFVVRYDPRDLSSVWFLDPSTQEYYRLSYSDRGNPPISIWELRAAKADLRKRGEDIDEIGIFAAIERIRARSEEAKGKTKKARRDRHRIKRAEKLAKQTNEPKAKTDAHERVPPQFIAGETDLEELFSEDIQPFDTGDSS